MWLWLSRSLDSAQPGRRPISLSGCAGRLNTRSSVPRLVKGWPSLQGAGGTGACSLLGESPETVMGRRDFVLGTGSPALGTRVQRSKSPRGGYGHVCNVVTLVLRCPEAGHVTGGRPSSCAFPGASAPSSLAVEPGEEPAHAVVAVQKPRAGMLPPCVKSPLQVCVGLLASQTEFEDGALSSLHLPHLGRGPLQPPLWAARAPRLAHLCPCSLNVSQCRWRLLNLVREGRAVSRLCHGFWSAVWSFPGVEGD